MTSCRPVTRSSTRTWQCGSQPVTQATWRAVAAKEQGVPAYVIFHDATLRQIAAELPSTLAGLATVNGVGEAKLARYGQQILDALAASVAAPG